jgi:hypothetical protein
MRRRKACNGVRRESGASALVCASLWALRRVTRTGSEEAGSNGFIFNPKSKWRWLDEGKRNVQTDYPSKDKDVY